MCIGEQRLQVECVPRQLQKYAQLFSSCIGTSWRAYGRTFKRQGLARGGGPALRSNNTNVIHWSCCLIRMLLQGAGRRSLHESVFCCATSLQSPLVAECNRCNCQPFWSYLHYSFVAVCVLRCERQSLFEASRSNSLLLFLSLCSHPSLTLDSPRLHFHF